MVDPMHFEAHADIYADARPPYPEALWGRIRDLGLLEPGRAALDLGAGTGQATGPLLAAGLHVTAVEPGPRLAAQLKTTHPAADVVVCRAEEFAGVPHSYDLVVAATSIHWMDLDAVLPKVHDLLTPNGRFLVWRNVFGDATAETTPFRQRIFQIVADRDQRSSPAPRAEDAAPTADAATRSGLFAVEDASTYRWSVELDAAAVGRLFATFSNWSSEEVQRAVAAAQDLGGTVVEHYASWLLVLAPVPREITPASPPRTRRP